MLGDWGHDADWFWVCLEQKEIKPCIPRQRSSGRTVKYDRRKYKRRKPYRNDVRKAQGPAAGRNPLRQMPDRRLLSHLPRRNRHVLAMHPEPKALEDGKMTPIPNHAVIASVAAIASDEIFGFRAEKYCGC